MTDEKSTEIISKTLKELRIHLHLTQEQISKDLNIARQTYSYFETGNRTPSLEMARRLAEYHNITIDQLVNTGIPPAYSDPFDSLPEPYQKIVRAYHKLSPNTQKEFESYLEYLVQKDQK